jgi:hypothetical protein
VVRRAVGYHRYDTAAEVELLNQIYALLRLQINFFTPQQKLISKTRQGAKVIKRYDAAQTPYQRLLADERIDEKIKTGLTQQYLTLNPAPAPPRHPRPQRPASRAHSGQGSTNPATRSAPRP